MGYKVKFVHYAYCALTTILIFAITYYSSENIAASNENRFKFYFEWEKKIPLLPIFYIFYYGIFLLPLAIPKFIKTKVGLISLTVKMIACIIISFVFFILLPSELGYNPSEMNRVLSQFTKKITGSHNLFPSLHVSLTIIIIQSFWINTRKRSRSLLAIVEILLLLSTIFTHQHHVMDLVGGIALALVINNFEKRIQNGIKARHS